MQTWCGQGLALADDGLVCDLDVALVRVNDDDDDDDDCDFDPSS